MDRQEFAAGAVRFDVEYRQFGGDRGPAVQVYGDVDGKPVPLLRFDCFDNDPHYHYDPEGKNLVLKLNPETIADPVAWTLGELRVNLRTMVRVAGYADKAAEIDPESVARVLPRIQEAIRASAAAAR